MIYKKNKYIFNMFQYVVPSYTLASCFFLSHNDYFDVRDYSFIVSWTYFLSLISFNLLSRQSLLWNSIFNIGSMVIFAASVIRDSEEYNLNLYVGILP